MNYTITREDILTSLQGSLENLDYVHAMWEGGAAVFGRLDEWSDIDLYFDVDDDKVENTFSVIEHTIVKLSPSNRKYLHPPLPWEGLFQVFYQLENTSPYLLLDIVVMQHSAQEKLLQPEIHGEAVFFFDKSGVSRIPPFNWEEWNSRLREHLATLKITFPMFQTLVTKEIYRKNALEALSAYHACTLRPLVEVLRMRYKPARYAFHTRYAQFDLPSEAVKRLESLSYVTGIEDIQAKRQIAEDWFYQEVERTEAFLDNLRSND
jgi:hypothetical protein